MSFCIDRTKSLDDFRLDGGGSGRGRGYRCRDVVYGAESDWRALFCSPNRVSVDRNTILDGYTREGAGAARVSLDDGGGRSRGL